MLNVYSNTGSTGPDAISADLARRRDELLELLRSMRGVAVAFSGGVDSAVVAQAAQLSLGSRALAVTAHSPSVAAWDRHDAEVVARQIGIRHLVIATAEFANPDYQANRGDRCYYCKSELYRQLASRRVDWGVEWIVSGANLDDLGDYRPGLQAAAEFGVRHPLQEVGLTKVHVRALARHWQLPVADKPASPCLASRIAPGVTVTAERVARVEHAEAFLRQHGLTECRVRVHEGDLVRIEVPLASLPQLVAPQFRAALVTEFDRLGFRYVTLDLAGFRSGSLNALVNLDLKQRYQMEVGHACPDSGGRG
jgi:uncharacterized protein